MISFDFIELLKNKPICRYGKHCLTQSKIAHAKKYQHWFKPNVSDDSVTPEIVTEDNGEEEEQSMDEDESDSEEDEDDCMDTDEE